MADNLNTGRLQMTDETFRLLRDFIYEHSGIFFPDNKKPQLENRLSLRIKANNLPDFEKYYYMLKYDPQSPREIRALFDSVTTNETSFFRSPPQIQAFQEKALPEILQRKAGEGDKTLRLWSAGCSTGDEPYTLGMVALEVLGGAADGWDVKIFASDISEKALKSARAAVYNEYTLRSVPPEIKEKYFVPEDSQYRVCDDVRMLVEFQYMNFNDEKRVKLMQGLDVVFCRNVLIYFDDAARKRFVSQLYDNLNPGGYLFIGHSESLHNISRAFKLVHFPGALGYKKE
ncbi:MAG: protein-glutamate O-methyltransferase CheR [Bacteriovoracaceae bacterium]|jgi:chemotaxis protein methyltransferase CheR|nr:protein-glutamate O-methyltransferase CheR [Deltaproteobacteria bacterium]MDI9542931.1 protein-glutamate O-methyltransferase CheR [Pseudomonadota bacterium]NLW68507.1 protein-glutamate O-methyltransferase CheR [Bacteriovoracaceae bacterium]HRR20452.1 protein-glutamate O-methyltransferase CheR [Desulfomonilia bacterium]HNR50531.1 protein-glutamate O-methyltransferase CheR [Deltaproteobacteria bacterium]